MAKKDKKRRKSEDIVLRSPDAVEAPESAPEKPEKVAQTGPEPVGMKERVKQGFLTARDALTAIEESPTTKVTPQIVGWLRRRL